MRQKKTFYKLAPLNLTDLRGHFNVFTALRQLCPFVTFSSCKLHQNGWKEPSSANHTRIFYKKIRVPLNRAAPSVILPQTLGFSFSVSSTPNIARGCTQHSQVVDNTECRRRLRHLYITSGNTTYSKCVQMNRFRLLMIDALFVTANNNG